MAKKDDIIIKRIKKVSGGHHGGAWKVAYADFVTAMMAFFLLLWLLNATEAENLAGLADYFAPTVGIKDEMGIGFRGGKAALSEGIGADKNTNKGVVFGGVPTGPITKVTTEIEEETDQDKQEVIKVNINEVDTKEKGTQNNDNDKSDSDQPPAPVTPPEPTEEDKKLAQAVDTTVTSMVKNRRIDEGSVEIKRTPEGLMIEIKDITGDSMFENNSANMKQKLKDGLVELAKILRNIPNNLAVVGHTSSLPVQNRGANYTKWELSADRANATRYFLEKNGVQEEQTSRIEGRADNVPYDSRKPESPVNNRIDIIILSKSDTPGHKKSAPDSLLLDVKSEQSKEFIDETNKKPIEDKDKKPEKITPNDDAKKAFEESDKIKSDAQKAKTEGKVIKEDNADPINFDEKIDKKPVETNKNDADVNKDFKNILDETDTDKAKAGKTAKPAAVVTPVKPDEADSDVINFDKTSRPSPVQKQPDTESDFNRDFQNILEETEKAKTAKKPKK